MTTQAAPPRPHPKQPLLTWFEDVPPVALALGAGGRGQLSSAKWHKDGKQRKQLFSLLGTGQVLQDDPF
jgi:hypothetical protein